MFTRVVEIRTKAGKVRDFSTTLNEKVLPLLRKQPGFIDEITLVSRAQPERILALSFWTNEQDAERYHQEQFPMVDEIQRPLLETAPNIEAFSVDLSTTHNISKGKAA